MMGNEDHGLAEVQIAAIEGAFAEHDRLLSRLRSELAELRDQPDGHATLVGERLSAIEARLDKQEQALRHVLQRLIGFFERGPPGSR